MKNLYYLVDHKIYQDYRKIYQDYFKYIVKKHGEKTVNPLIRIYINKIENIITFKIRTGYYLELLTPETMKLPGCTKSKITKNRNGKNLPSLDGNHLVCKRTLSHLAKWLNS